MAETFTNIITALFRYPARQLVVTLILTSLFFSVIAPITGAAQTSSAAASDAGDSAEPTDKKGFRLERISVAGGAELLTIFSDLHRGSNSSSNGSGDYAAEASAASVKSRTGMPLVSVVRDTLNDDDPENDRLRYLWMHTYTRPTLPQRIAAAVPFFYTRVASKHHHSSKHSPPHIIDLAAADQDVWQRFLWMALQNVLLDTYGFAVKVSSRVYRRNADDNRKAHIIRALAILSLYEAEQGLQPAFTALEMREIQARLMLTDATFGGIIDDVNLQHAYHKQTTKWHDIRGHNWELLRQRAEAEGLYFEPLSLPDGTATHAFVWVALPDLAENTDRRSFNKRFLNIADPWGDNRLRTWKGFSETRFLDADNRFVSDGAAGARRVEMIPLALYGLDHPKIPVLLVDFRDGANPKKREVSRRAVEDVARNILSLSRFGDIHYFLGRTIYDFVTGRRGMDINQPTRLRTYSQLKLLLALSESLDPQLRDEVNRRLERVSINPLTNSLQAEEQLACQQYAALIDYAKRPDGLPARLEKDRQAEVRPLVHNRTQEFIFRLASVLSFDGYTHREKIPSPELHAHLDFKRRMAHHKRFLREVAQSSPLIEVVWDIEEVRRSLRFIAASGAKADRKAVTAAAGIFARTQDDATRRLCLSTLSRINNETAKNELRRIHRDPTLNAYWQTLTAEYLRTATIRKQSATVSLDTTDDAPSPDVQTVVTAVKQ